MNRLLNFLFFCRHQHVAFPQRGIQICLDCGASRSYVIGGPFGDWHHSDAPAVEAFGLEVLP